jgi:hypothetical protein
VVPINDWLEPELRRGLREAAAPQDLWNRIQAPQAAPSNRSNRAMVWAMAATVILAAVGLSLVRPQAPVASRQMAFHCENPAELRAWVRANTGLDVPLQTAPPASIQLIGARNLGERVEIAYRAGNRDALLSVSRADAGSANLPHGQVSGNESSWVAEGQRFTLAAASAADLQLACKLCHPD